MDHKFTEQIRQWLETPEDERDYSVGALYLLKLSGNQIMYRNIISQIDRRHDQPRDRRLNVIKSFYVKFERKIPALVEDFCRYYAEHRNKTVVYYYDATALGSNYAVNEQDYRWWVVHEFERRGWQVEAVYLGNPMRHDEKYLLINQGFAGKQRLVPFFNRSNNEDLILAIQSAGISRGRNGFCKDKSGEKLAESEEDLLEHRTDGTDAFDTLYIGCEKFPYREAFSLPTTGIL